MDRDMFSGKGWLILKADDLSADDLVKLAHVFNINDEDDGDSV